MVCRSSSGGPGLYGRALFTDSATTWAASGTSDTHSFPHGPRHNLPHTYEPVTRLAQPPIPYAICTIPDRLLFLRFPLFIYFFF